MGGEASTGGAPTDKSSVSTTDTNAKTSSGGAGGSLDAGAGTAQDARAAAAADGPARSDAASARTSPDAAAATCYQEGLAAITQDLLKADITTLSSASFEGRKTGSPGERKAVDYIVGQFKAAGLDGVAGKYEQAFKVSNVSGTNTVAVLAGNDPDVKGEVIVVGAHHDHLGLSKTGSAYPGADDNASGTSAVMALGRAFAKCRGQLRRTIVFMTYGGEEQGIYGSYYYTRYPLFPIASTMYMVNHDMIGYVAKNKLEVSWGTAFAKQTLTAACQKVSFCKLIQSDMRNEQGTDSDTFAAVKVPYTGFYSGEHNCYHEVCDTVDKLDMAGVTDTTKLSFDLVYALASTSQGLLKSANQETGILIDRSSRPFRDHRRAPAAP
jgi:hypothetical protein